MQIQINTDHNIEGHETLVRHIEAEVRTALARFGEQITRVEVHLSAENAAKTAGADKRCLMEARCAGRQPVIVTHDAASLESAYDGAARKLQHVLKSTLGKLHDHKGAISIRTEATD
jgi:ribosome-associated translation inhibitor RaiA